MQINTNTVGYSNLGTNSNTRPDQVTDRKPSAKLTVRDAIKPEAQTPAVVNKDERGAQLARNAYAGASQRGSIVNMLV